MASVTVTTHTFKTVGNLDLKLDLFQRTSTRGSYDPKTPVVFFIHGGGFVGFNREHISPHVVQLSLLRGWNVISTDYRLLPQVSGKEMFEDVVDAYDFVQHKLFAILSGGGSTEKDVTISNIIVVGQSAGAYLAYLAGHYFTPRPLAILNYYGFASLDDSFGTKPPPGTPKLLSPSQVADHLAEEVHTSITPDFNLFDPSSLLDDLSRNPKYVRPPVNFDNPADNRLVLCRWIVQEYGMLSYFKGLDKSLDDIAWKDFPDTVLLHGDEDKVTPFEGSSKLIDILGPTAPNLFVGEGKDHCFDQPLYLGDDGFEPIERAWQAVDDIVRKKLS